MSGNLALKSTTSGEQNGSKLEYEFFYNFDSFHTKISYKSDILQLVEFLKDNFAEVDTIKKIEKVHLIAFKAWLLDNDYAPKSVHRKLSSCSSYFNFLIEKNLLEINPVNAIKRPRQTVIRETADLSDEEIFKLLNAVDKESSSYYLHRAILYVLFTTGIRKSELINLKLKNYKKIGDESIFELKAKGGKYLTKVVHPECAKIVDDYLDNLRTSENANDLLHPEDWLFRPTKNPKNPGELVKPLCTKSIDYIVKIHCKKIGIMKRISVHSARASYIGSALENGADLWKISKDVGHSSVRTTEEYNKRRLKLHDSPVYHLGFLKNSTKD